MLTGHFDEAVDALAERPGPEVWAEHVVAENLSR
jgi:hypothetical protein